MPKDLAALIVVVPVLLCAGTYAQMLFYGSKYGKFLVPTAVAQLPAYRSCPSQVEVTFTAYPKLQRGEGGLVSSSLHYPYVSSERSHQFTDCLDRTRLAAGRGSQF